MTEVCLVDCGVIVSFLRRNNGTERYSLYMYRHRYCMILRHMCRRGNMASTYFNNKVVPKRRFKGDTSEIKGSNQTRKTPLVDPRRYQMTTFWSHGSNAFHSVCLEYLPHNVI